ncbi:MAG: RNA polymerase sigma factor [Pseudomonadales bacterium]
MAKIIEIFRTRAARDRRFRELVQPHLKPMYRVAYRWAQNAEDAEDLVQETLTKVSGRIDEMEKIETRGPWLIKILYRSFVDFHRKRGRSPGDSPSNRDADSDLLDEELGNAANPDIARRLELQRDLLKALEVLNADQREVILLHDAEGYTATEVALILDISEGTVKSRLHRARAHFKNFWCDGTF